MGEIGLLEKERIGKKSQNSSYVETWRKNEED